MVHPLLPELLHSPLWLLQFSMLFTSQEPLPLWRNTSIICKSLNFHTMCLLNMVQEQNGDREQDRENWPDCQRSFLSIRPPTYHQLKKDVRSLISGSNKLLLNILVGRGWMGNLQTRFNMDTYKGQGTCYTLHTEQETISRRGLGVTDGNQVIWIPGTHCCVKREDTMPECTHDNMHSEQGSWCCLWIWH